MKLGTENRKQTIAAVALAVVLLLVVGYEFMPSLSTIASTTAPATTASTDPAPRTLAHPASRRGSAASSRKEKTPQSLDPTLNLRALAQTEQIKYEGSGRNIFVAQPDPVTIPAAAGNGTTDHPAAVPIYAPPAAAQAPPIPLKFYGFANKPGEPKKVFLIKGEDTFVAAEGEIIDRRYKIVKISPTTVEIQDVVGSGPPQSIPLTQG
ncbi:MAG TPA: hypothetical protein VND65_20285 [Candidatus Binatia bacterium]|nr:hypothetical protein [Candidatus Binatia bacterium]